MTAKAVNRRADRAAPNRLEVSGRRTAPRTRRSLVAIATVIVACQRESRPSEGRSPDTSVLATGAVADTSFPDARRRPADTVAAVPFQWTVDSARSAVMRAVEGPVAVSGTVRQPFIRQMGTVLSADRATVQVFVYGDAVSRGRDTDPLDTVRVAPATMTVSWTEPVTLVTNNNLAAIVLTRDARLRSRIRDALSLGH